MAKIKQGSFHNIDDQLDSPHFTVLIAQMWLNISKIKNTDFPVLQLLSPHLYWKKGDMPFHLK
jgi:hypothetical protein